MNSDSVCARRAIEVRSGLNDKKLVWLTFVSAGRVFLWIEAGSC